MSDPVIRVENLGKKYSLRPNTLHRASYSHLTFREMLTEKTRKLFSRKGTDETSNEEFWALREISFEVNQGEVIGIIGRNGAGKSTLLKILSRITEPSTGQVRVKGRVGSLLEVGTGFHPELTGRENIYLNGAILGMTRAEIETKFDAIVDFAGVAKFVDTPVKHFSSGMYVRLAFAVAANLDPEILLIDEVLAVGDAEFQKKCLGKMKEVSERQGRTILFVSHRMDAIERLSSRVLLIDGGNLRVESADVRSVVRSYLAVSNDSLHGSSQEWCNRGDQFNNSWFQPQHFFLADANGAPLKIPARNDEEMWVHIVADLKTLDPALKIGYAIYAESGEPLFRTYHTDAKEEEWPRLRLGRVALRTKIPPRLLNEGTYRVELVGQLHFRQWIFEPGGNNPFVLLQVQGGLSDSPLWNEARPGFLAPVMKWELSETG